MANINRIDVLLKTGKKQFAGTNGSVYIGIAGREFHTDSAAQDFENGDKRTYTLGVGANILDPERNDPRSPQLDTGDLSKFPVYLRFEPHGNNPDWNVENVIVTVNPGTKEIKFSNARLNFAPDIWLGQKYGKFIYMSKT